MEVASHATARRGRRGGRIEVEAEGSNEVARHQLGVRCPASRRGLDGHGHDETLHVDGGAPAAVYRKWSEEIHREVPEWRDHRERPGRQVTVISELRKNEIEAAVGAAAATDVEGALEEPIGAAIANKGKDWPWLKVNEQSVPDGGEEDTNPVVVWGRPPLNDQVTELSARARTANVAVAQLSGHVGALQPATRRHAADASPATVTAFLDTAAAYHRATAAGVTGIAGAALNLTGIGTGAGARRHGRIGGRGDGRTRSAMRTVWPVAKQRLAATPTRIE